MAAPHALPGEVFDLRPHGEAADQAVTTSLVKTAGLQVLRVVLAAGQGKPAHRVAGDLTVQCLAGRVAVTALGATRELAAGQMLYLGGGEGHALSGVEDATLLVTILLRPPGKA